MTMTKNMTKLALTAAVIAITSAPAMAAEKKMTKEVTSLVGYNVTETVEFSPAITKLFKKTDTNANGTIDAKEFQRGNNLEYGYEVFLNMDKDNSKSVTMAEFGSYNRTKGNTQMRSGLEKSNAVKGTNIKTKPVYQERSYYEAVEPKIVKEEAIN